MSDIKPIRRSDRVSKKPPPPFEPNDSSSSSNSRRSKVTTKTTKTITSLKSPKKSTKSQATTTKTSSVLSKPKTKTTTTTKSSKVDLPALKKATVSSKSSRSSKPLTTIKTSTVPKKTTTNNKKKNVEVRSKSLKTITTTDVTATNTTKSKNSLEQDEQDLMNSTYDMLQGTRNGGRGGGPRNILSNQKQSTVDQNSNQIDSIFAKLKQWKSQISEGENRLETMLKAANINLIDEEQSNGVCGVDGNIDGGKPYDEDNDTMKQLLSKQIGSLGFDLKYDILCGLIDDQNIIDENQEKSMKRGDVEKVGKQIESSIEKIWTKRYNIFGDNFSENVDVDEDDEEEDVEDRIDPIKYRELYLQNVIEPLESELFDRIFIEGFCLGEHRNCNIESKIAKYVKVPFLFYNLYLWKRLWFYRNRQYPTIFESFEQSHRTIREQIDCYYRRLQMEAIISFNDVVYDDDVEQDEIHDVYDNVNDDLDLDHLFSIFYHYFRKTIDETLNDISNDIPEEDSTNLNSKIRNQLMDLSAGTTALIQHLLVLFDIFRKVLLNLIELKHSGGAAVGGGGGSTTRDDPISCCIAREFSNRKSFAIKCLLCLFNFLSKINQQQMALLVVVDGDVKHRRQNNNRKQSAIDSEQFNILEQFCETVLTLCGGEEHYSVFQQFFRMLPRIQRGMGFEQKLRQFQLFVRLLPPSTVQCYLPHILGEICKLIIDYDVDGGMKMEDVNGVGGGNLEDINLITNLRDVYPLMGTAFAGKSFLGNSPKKSTANDGKAVSLSTILDYVVKILYYGFSKYNNFDSRTPKMLDNFLACQRHLSKETKEMILLIKYKVSNELINN